MHQGGGKLLPEEDGTHGSGGIWEGNGCNGGKCGKFSCFGRTDAPANGSSAGNVTGKAGTERNGAGGTTGRVIPRGGDGEVIDGGRP